MGKTLAACLAVLAATGCQGSATDLGRRPDWTLTLPDGKKVSASDYDNKVLIVDFWATWCPPCRKEIPHFIQLKKDYGGKGLEILGFSFDREEATHAQWVKEQGVNYLSIFAETEAAQKVVEQFQKVIGQIEGLPTTLVIDRKGQIVYKHLGYGSYEDFEKVIKPLF